MNEKNITTDLQDKFRHLLHEWFVRYNPLYFFSALCVLFGIFLVSQGLEAVEWARGQIVLTAVVQLYELLLIAGAALLFRGAGQDRPAVILGLMEVVFLFDCTFRTEVIATLEHIGLTLAVMWVVMIGVKLIALAWTFRLKLSMSVFIIPLLAALGIAGVPQVLGGTYIAKETVHLIATWYAFGLTAFVLWKRPTIPCTLTFDEWGQTVLRRATRAAWIIWAGFYLCHLFVWVEQFDILLTLAYVVPFALLVAFLSTKESWIWANGVGAIGLAFANPPTVAFTALVVGIILGWQARHIQCQRLYVGTVLAFHVSVWTFGWQGEAWPEQQLWLNLTTAAILVAMAWRLRLRTALFPLVLGLYPIGKVLRSLGMLGWGILLLAIGFIALIVGVAINWSQRSHNQGDEKENE